MKAAILSLCLLIASSAAASDVTLKGLNQLDVVIEQLEKSDKDMGLTRESLQSLVTVAIQRNIPAMKVQTSVGEAYMYVVVTCEQTTSSARACFVSVQLVRPVKVLKDDGTTEVGVALARVWNEGVLLHFSTTEMASKVREVVENKITDLAAEYYRQNQ